MPTVTKSTYLKARAAPKLAWFLAHSPDDFEPPDEVVLARIREGIRVGELARERFPDGVLVPGGSREEALENTGRAMDRGVPLFEAVLQADGMLCRTDVLVPRNGGWEIIEVKSGTSVKEDHLWDVAFQVATARAAGLRVERAALLHINPKYVRGKELDAGALFREEDVTEKLEAHVEAVPGEVEGIRTAIQGPRPEVTLLEALESGAVWPRGVVLELPKHNVTELYRESGLDWIRRGILRIEDVPDLAGLSRNHRIQRETLRRGTPHVEPGPLRAWLEELRYPLYHLDFETVSPGVPLLPGTRPYRRIPFQFSLHIEHTDGRLEHFGYLHEDASDPRPPLIRALRPLGGQGSVLAHNASFERGVLRELLAFRREEEWLGAAARRVVDTLRPFQAFWYYHPEQRGSCSLKRVLPALTGEAYDDLDVSDGEGAGLVFLRMARGEVEGEEKARLRAALERYCALDTRGMVEVVRVLRGAARALPPSRGEA